ncbi:hypothetical protein [Spirillospora sp. NPDC048819]|uniref:hypothetical protein n=1 Tax=Spirillospora sp. NPDC048819 TaxID=3155268 RepID=UPI0033F614FD
MIDRFQLRLVGIALDVVGGQGFVLGGGHAVQIHSMTAVADGNRPPEDGRRRVWEIKGDLIFLEWVPVDRKVGL